MKVLQVCAFAAPYEGNFIKLLKALRSGLIANGDDMIFAFPITAKELNWVKDLEKETDVYFLPLGHAYLIPQTYKTLSKIYKDHPDIKIVHSHFELYDVPVEKTAPKNVKVFWHLHDAIEAYTDIKNRIICRLRYGLFHGRATLLSVSQVHVQYVEKLGFPKKNIYYIPNGIDTNRITKIENKTPEYDFLLFGWEYQRKGVDLCVKAAKTFSDSVKIVIVCNENIESEIKQEFGLVPNNIQFVKPVSNVNELYAKTKAFLHISRFEGQSYALLEAAYSGLAVVCSDIKANVFASEFPTVIMTKNEDVKDIANAMQKINDNNDFLSKVDTTRKIIEEKYSLECWVNRIMEMYYDA